MMNKPAVFSLLFLAAASALPLFAQRLPERFVARTYTNATGETMPYRLFIPRDYGKSRRYPLVVILHGSGGLGSDNRRQIFAANAYGPSAWTTPAIQRRHPAFVIAPQAPSGSAWSTTKSGSVLSNPARLMLEILDSLRREFSIDANRLYLTGQSLGGFGTWDIVTRRPEVFAAAAPLSGGGQVSAVSAIKDLPIWAFHGAADDIVPVQHSREMVEALRKLGGNVKYTEYPGVGHNTWENVYADSAMMEWMFAQRRRQ